MASVNEKLAIPYDPSEQHEGHRELGSLSPYHPETISLIANAALAGKYRPEFGVPASGSPNFSDGIFLRDWTIAAEASVKENPEIALAALESAHANIGRKVDLASGEEIGNLPHETRFEEYSRSKPEQLAIMQHLAEERGIEIKDGIFKDFSGADIPERVIILLYLYREEVDRDILERPDIRELLQMTGRWLSDRISKSDIGLLEFQRSSPLLMKYHTMFDGYSALVHENGSLAYPDRPIATATEQSLAHAALGMQAEMAEETNLVPADEIGTWRMQREQVQRNTIKHMWREDIGQWVMGIDRSPVKTDEFPNGTPRHLTSGSVLAVDLMQRDILKDLPPDLQPMQETWIRSIAEHNIFGPNIFTPIGPRCLDKRHPSAKWPFMAYQGSYTVWRNKVNDAAMACFNHGLITAGRILATCNMAAEITTGHPDEGGKFHEFSIVGVGDKDNDVVYWPLYDGLTQEALDRGAVRIVAPNVPESHMTWLEGQYQQVLNGYNKLQDEPGWKTELTKAILKWAGKHRQIETRPAWLDKKEAFDQEMRLLSPT